MDTCHAINGVRTDYCQACHMYFAIFYNRHCAEFIDIIRIASFDVFEMAAIHLVDNHIDTREQGLEHINGPFLQSFGHNRMVSIGDDCASNNPSLVPF